ncbi:MAG: RedB protein [Luteitalea sp.]
MPLRDLLRHNALGIAAVALSCPIIAMGLTTLIGYANTPGPAGLSPVTWPQEASAARSHDRQTLLLFAHPDCACTRATISELARIMAVARSRIDAVVHVVGPGGGPADAGPGHVWRSAAAIPGVRVVQDRDAVEARRFGARTSGQTLLYDARGQLAFSGGLTVSRGHEGDSVGREAILAAASGETSARAVTPVFGCILLGDE